MDTVTASDHSDLSQSSDAALLSKPGRRFKRDPIQLYEFTFFTSVILMVMTFIVISLFLHHIEIVEDADKAPTRKVQDLVNLLNQAESKQENLEKELSKLRQRLITLQEDPSQIRTEAKDPEFQKLMRLAGLTEAQGTGIIVKLQDKTNSMAPDKNQQSTAGRNNVQSDDILKLVNDLKAAGATAISINGQRIVTTSEIVNAGPTITVNQTRISPPIEIRAIGTPKLLRASLEIRGGILEYLEFFGIKGQIKESANIKVPPYTGSI